MTWNWELPEWPKFRFDAGRIAEIEKQFLFGTGGASAFLKSLDEENRNRFIVEMISLEGAESSKIEGEVLDRESLQSSIRQHFGMGNHIKKEKFKEAQLAKILIDAYETFDAPLTHEMLCNWHSILFSDQSHITDCGKYRTHAEPMQIVSGRYGNTEQLIHRYSGRKIPENFIFDLHQLSKVDYDLQIKFFEIFDSAYRQSSYSVSPYGSPVVFFEAPPSAKVLDEMTVFIQWFNDSKNSGSVLARAAIAHIYFESIHPFEDGNGRIGRVLVEKVFSQGVGRSVLIAISKVLEKRKKDYYLELGKCNQTLDIDDWVEFFAKVTLQAQKDSLNLLYFLIEKHKILSALSGKMNARQEKVLLRMFTEGPDGFTGGLSAENYIAITHTSRATATRDLTDLVDKKALVKTGELRHTRYWLNLEVKRGGD